MLTFADGYTASLTFLEICRAMPPRFGLGQVVATQGALELGVDFLPWLGLHQRGVWGDVPCEDWEANEEAL